MCCVLYAACVDQRSDDGQFRSLLSDGAASWLGAGQVWCQADGQYRTLHRCNWLPGAVHGTLAASILPIVPAFPLHSTVRHYICIYMTEMISCMNGIVDGNGMTVISCANVVTDMPSPA